jgi:hypothetical protein
MRRYRPRLVDLAFRFLTEKPVAESSVSFGSLADIGLELEEATDGFRKAQPAM